MIKEPYQPYSHYIFGFAGVLVDTQSGAKFQQSADDWQWKPGRVEILKELHDAGKVTSCVSNQAGCAFEYSKFSAEEIDAEIQRACAHANIGFMATCHSSTSAKALPEYYHQNDPRRKPGHGMIEEALAATGCIRSETLMIGFLPEDRQAAAGAGIAYATIDEFFGEEEEGEPF